MSLLPGALLGLLTGFGLLLIAWFSPPLRRVSLDDRLAPYLRDAPRPSRLLAVPGGPVTSFGALERVLRPVLGDAVRVLERVVGGSGSIRRRLAALGRGQTVEHFRVEQVVWGVLGLFGGAGFAVVLAVLGGVVHPVSVVLCCLAGSLAGVLGRDWWLGAQVRRREQLLLAEFPVVAELLALAVTAGEGPAGAMQRVCRLSGGELARELSAVLAETRMGTPLPLALHHLGERSSLDALARFAAGMAVALERGTPLADVLRAQAVDVREAGKRALLEAGGRKEIAMMVPVVFLVLPTTVVFALYPGLINLVQLAR